MYRNQQQRDFARGLRNEPTDPEKRLWHFLRAEKLGVKFRRQAAIGAYIVDFVCFSHGLVVELDGPQHVEEQGRERDARRTAWLASRGLRVIRFRNHEVDDDIRLVVEEIRRVLRECEDQQPPTPAHPPAGGVPGGAVRKPPRRGEGAGKGKDMSLCVEGRGPEKS